MVPEAYRKEVMSLAHDSKMIEHLAVKKNSNMILAHLYRPNIRRDVAEHFKRPLLTYLIVYLRTGSSLIDLWTWSVSRLKVYSSSAFRQEKKRLYLKMVPYKQ
jgi:hypothetical protein